MTNHTLEKKVRSVIAYNYAIYPTLPNFNIIVLYRSMLVVCCYLGQFKSYLLLAMVIIWYGKMMYELKVASIINMNFNVYLNSLWLSVDIFINIPQQKELESNIHYYT